MRLLVTQMGRESAASAVKALFEYKKPGEHDVLINFGFCAAPPNHPLGSVLFANELRCESGSVPLDAPWVEGVLQTVLETVDKPFEGSCGHAVDMEACGVYASARDYFKAGRIVFFKVVSDHFAPENFEREEALSRLGGSMPLLEKLIETLKGEADG